MLRSASLNEAKAAAMSSPDDESYAGHASTPLLFVICSTFASD